LPASCFDMPMPHCSAMPGRAQEIVLQKPSHSDTRLICPILEAKAVTPLDRTVEAMFNFLDTHSKKYAHVTALLGAHGWASVGWRSDRVYRSERSPQAVS